MFKPTKVKHYLKAMNARGIRSQEVLAGCGLSASDVDKPNSLVDILQYQTIVSNMIRLTKNQAIGLELGSEMNLTDLGLMGYALISSRDILQAADLWINYSNSMLGMLFNNGIIERAEDDWEFFFTSSSTLGFMSSFLYEEALAITFRFAKILTGETPVLSRLELSYPAPSHEQRYVETFGVKPVFNSHKTRMVFIKPSIRCPMVGHDQEVFNICLQHCSNILAKKATKNSMVSQLRTLFLQDPKNIPDIQRSAKLLGISISTMRRNLTSEKTSYRTIVNAFRKELAIEYLNSMGLVTKQVAFQLGYKDTNAFRRAFKSWTGKSVQQYLSDQA